MKRRRGYALILVLASAAVIAAVLIGTSANTTPLRREAFRRVNADAARALAHSAVDLARVRLKDDPGYRGAEGVPLGAGTVTVVVTREGEGWTVLGRGTVQGVHARTRVVLRADQAVVGWKDL